MEAGNNNSTIKQFNNKTIYQYLNMRQLSVFFLAVFISITAIAQTPKTYTSSEILLQLKKLNVLGSVLYIAAHPDDENTRLLAYLANEKLYRTGYMSLTRGDGGQNLIGDEQGIDLGLIRTQELLAARRIDGAEQFFSRAYDFGFCKSPEEALATWGHDKILSDVVWVIRKFKPDVIIARFPEDSRAGHGHHAASGILAREAFDAAADPAKFPEQLTQGVTVWQAKRMLWNTFNFGSTNTQNENQFKVDVGMYNPLLGKSYGEIAALSRSQHKSQGFGVPAQRGSVIEYFETIKGDKPVNDLMDGVDVSWGRAKDNNLQAVTESIIKNYSAEHPEKSIAELVGVYKKLELLNDTYWKEQKQNDIKKILEQCSGLFIEATANSQYAVVGDSLKISATINNRSGITLKNAAVKMFEIYHAFDSVKRNVNNNYNLSIFIRPDQKFSQPYWLENKMEKGSFNITDQQQIGKAENDPISILFDVTLGDVDFTFKKPVRYKFTDPVKGEIYQPVFFVPQITVSVNPLTVLNANSKSSGIFDKKYRIFVDGNKLDSSLDEYADLSKLQKGGIFLRRTSFDVAAKLGNQSPANELTEVPVDDSKGRKYFDIREIDYDHIPSIKYFKEAHQKLLITDFKIVGKSIGYIPGAGDKVPQALEQMGYKVTTLKEADITPGNLKQFDAIVTGVRVYNTSEWMGNVYESLMQYVKEGGVLLTQYNTNNFISNIKSKIGPYNFTINRNRVTDENAKVNFLLPNHPALNYPNKITEKDFEGWIQESSIYNAEKIDSNYQRILSMKDPGETEQDGSLIIADYGKGKFVYTGLVFFRELPAGVPGAYRLLANLLAPSKSPSMGETLKSSQTKDSKLSGKKETQ